MCNFIAQSMSRGKGKKNLQTLALLPETPRVPRGRHPTPDVGQTDRGVAHNGLELMCWQIDRTISLALSENRLHWKHITYLHGISVVLHFPFLLSYPPLFGHSTTAERAKQPNPVSRKFSIRCKTLFFKSFASFSLVPGLWHVKEWQTFLVPSHNRYPT